MCTLLVSYGTNSRQFSIYLLFIINLVIQGVTLGLPVPREPSIYTSSVDPSFHRHPHICNPCRSRLSVVHDEHPLVTSRVDPHLFSTRTSSHTQKSRLLTYPRLVDPSVLAFSLSLHRHPSICIPFSSRLVCCS